MGRKRRRRWVTVLCQGGPMDGDAFSLERRDALGLMRETLWSRGAGRFRRKMYAYRPDPGTPPDPDSLDPLRLQFTGESMRDDAPYFREKPSQ
jgi:hypothetical protein